MIGYYPYVIGALLLIYPHSTHQFTFHWTLSDIIKDINSEKPGFLKSGATYPDVACDKLTPQEKQDICDDAMKQAVASEPYMTAAKNESVNRNCRAIHVGSFLDVKSTLPVPQLADERDAYTCKPITIEGMDLAKKMWYCKNRVFTVKNSDKTDQAAGFFMASGKTRKTLDKVFIFKPSETNGQAVVPWAKLDDVNRIEDAYNRSIGRWMK